MITTALQMINHPLSSWRAITAAFAPELEQIALKELLSVVIDRAHKRSGNLERLDTAFSGVNDSTPFHDAHSTFQ